MNDRVAESALPAATLANRRPRIGITRGVSAVDEYRRAIEIAGGEAVELMANLDRAENDLASLDGLVLSGGPDIDPKHYGEAAHPKTEVSAPERDEYELLLARKTLDSGLPTLAICRGLQIVSVGFGGTLWQHVPEFFGDRVRHEARSGGSPDRGLIAEHVVSVEANTQLAALVGRRLTTGSRHHQAVNRVPDRFRVTARTSDNVIEALEPIDTPGFWLGVQWHPESTMDADDGQSRAIFGGLIQAAIARL